MISQMPKADRPRERLVQHGVQHLSLAELIAIILGTGTKGKSVIRVAEELIASFKGIDGLLEASLEELMEVKGIGQAKAIQLKAAFGIALKRIAQNFPEKQSIFSARDVFELTRLEMSAEKQEVALVLLKDARGRLIRRERIAVGTLTEVLIHPREVFYPAVRHKAHSLILVHNHPSGDPTPSTADISLTRLLVHSSKVMGIHLDDHIIVGATSFVSLKEKGVLLST